MHLWYKFELRWIMGTWNNSEHWHQTTICVYPNMYRMCLVNCIVFNLNIKIRIKKSNNNFKMETSQHNIYAILAFFIILTMILKHFTSLFLNVMVSFNPPHPPPLHSIPDPMIFTNSRICYFDLQRIRLNRSLSRLLRTYKLINPANSPNLH